MNCITLSKTFHPVPGLLTTPPPMMLVSFNAVTFHVPQRDRSVVVLEEMSLLPSPKKLPVPIVLPLPPYRRAARNGAEQYKPAYSLRVLQPEALRDHAAEREPHDMRNGHCTGVQHVNHVLH